MKVVKTNEVVRGAFFLTIAGVISKVLSATYRVPLQNLTGDIGFYIYQQIYPIIGIVMVLALYGYPAAISKLIAERVNKGFVVNVRQVYAPIFLVLVSINGFLAGSLYFMAPKIASWIGDTNLIGVFELAAILFLVLPLLAGLRGLYQGHDHMLSTAYSQVTEQMIRVSIIVTCAYFIYVDKLGHYAIGYAGVLASIAGMVIATMTGMLFIKSKKLSPLNGKKTDIPWRYYIRTCFSFGLIAAMIHMILLLLQLVDVFTIVPSLIHVDVPLRLAMESKGIFDRGQPLIQFGIVFGSSFALALVPTVVKEHPNRTKFIREALLFSFYIALAASTGLMLLMTEVNQLLYLDTAGTASLRILMGSVGLAAIVITCCSILQSMGSVYTIALCIFISLSVKWILNWLLVPHLQIIGSALATVISLFLLMVIVLILLHKKLPKLALIRNIHWQALFLAIGSMCLFIVGMKYFILVHIDLSRFGLLLYVTFVVAVGTMIYIGCLLRYRTFSDHQLNALPCSNMILTISKVITKKE